MQSVVAQTSPSHRQAGRGKPPVEVLLVDVPVVPLLEVPAPVGPVVLPDVPVWPPLVEPVVDDPAALPPEVPDPPISGADWWPQPSKAAVSSGHIQRTSTSAARA